VTAEETGFGATEQPASGASEHSHRAMHLILGRPEWRHGASGAGLCAVVPAAMSASLVGTNTCDLRTDQRFGPARACSVDADGMVVHRPEPVDVRLVDIGEIRAGSGGAADPELSALVPLFLLGPAGEVYSATVETETRVVFLRCGDAPGALTPDGRLVDLPAILRAHAHHAQELNNHNNSHWKLRKWHPEEEIEQKFDLPADADVWAFTRDVLAASRTGGLSGFVPHLRLPYTRWEFDNHLFERGAGPTPDGYVSFIPEAGKYIVKDKRFPRDQLLRFERVLVHVDIDGTYEEYLARNYPGEQFVAHPVFRRLRYDVDVESLDTGNHYVVSVDRCEVAGTPHRLTQCEVEYVDTRSLEQPRLVMEEHERLATAVEQRLRALDGRVRRSFTSKLTFLRSLPTAGRPLTGVTDGARQR
jgi:hypothetical protein